MLCHDTHKQTGFINRLHYTVILTIATIDKHNLSIKVRIKIFHDIVSAFGNVSNKIEQLK